MKQKDMETGTVEVMWHYQCAVAIERANDDVESKGEI